MITRNFENLTATLLQDTGNGAVFGTLPMTDVAGQVWYKAVNWGSSTFPASVADGPTLDPAAAGLSIGAGESQPSPYDFNLERTITSGVSLAVSAVVPGTDAPGDPWLRYHLTVTNTSAAPVTVSEVGLKQVLRVKRRPGPDDTVSVMGNKVFLLDRTVLDEPITIAPGDAGVILYKLRTNAAPERSAGGVELAGWTWGSDAAVAAVLDAARDGRIDLQADALWRVGDVRMVPIGKFYSQTVTHTAQTVAMVISDFAEYERCGNVVQFDFYDTLTLSDRMNEENSTVGGYGGSEMCRVTLPALAAALPDWLRTRLRPFSVKVSEGDRSGTVVTVGGNLLALRSEVEVLGAVTHAFPGEGRQAALYRIGVNASKNVCGSYGEFTDWWLRSPDSTTSRFCRVTKSGGCTNNLVTKSAIAAFGCL